MGRRVIPQPEFSRIGIRLPSEERFAAEQAADEQGVTLSELTRVALMREIARWQVHRALHTDEGSTED
jgi:hypothetical protein